jgi:type III restriction enzyme
VRCPEINGYYFLGKDWSETPKEWKRAKQPIPPVMITVAITTYLAARAEFAFTHTRINIDELYQQTMDPNRAT